MQKNPNQKATKGEKMKGEQIKGKVKVKDQNQGKNKMWESKI